MQDGKFIVKKVTPFADFVSGVAKELDESDMCIQTDSHFVQFLYEEGDDEVEKYKIKPGFFQLVYANGGPTLERIEFRKRRLLEDITSTSSILKEARTFFKKLHIYEQLNLPKKRGVLLYSAPGCGKSSSIEKFCTDFAAEDAGTVVIVWPTSKMEADDALRFFNSLSEYTPECTRLVLIMEDIGGGEPGEGRGSLAVDSGLLNLLDGIGATFKLPTFIIATTNHPESLLQSLADRPGRFDLLLKLNPPNCDERTRLLSFIAKRELNDEEKIAIGKKGTDDFSVAHLEEIVVRSLLHDKTYVQVIDEMIEHTKRFKKGFEDREGLGF